MREILFKAKAINRDKGYHRTSYKNGDWVYGLITRLYDDRFESLPAEMTDVNGVSEIEIDHTTICQYTGLTDKNGNKIWENDIVKFEDCEYGDCFVNVGEIAYDTDTMSYFITNRITVDMEDMDIKNDVEVIGNIFDNPELLKGE